MTITLDLFILIAMAFGTAYGLFFGRNRILGILVNLYIAFAVTSVAGSWVFDVLSNFRIISANLTTSEFGTKVLLLILIAAILTLKSELSGLDTGSSLSKFQTGIMGFFTAGFALSASFSFMSGSELAGLNSNFALLIANYQIIWVLVPVVLIIVLPFFNKH